MHNKPMIAVACNMDAPADRVIAGVNSQYTDAVLAAEGIPFLVPMAEEDVLDAYLDAADGLFIPGGIDVCPLFYGENPHEMLGRVNYDLDAFQVALVKLARKRGMPILGVCRGIQIINVAFGGTLVQHIERHKQKNLDGSRPYHKVEAQDGSFIAEVFGTSFGVNSFHHQAVKNVAEGFKATALAYDGIIEGIESVCGSWAVGVQWHPERMIYKGKQNLELFRRFVKECEKFAGH